MPMSFGGVSKQKVATIIVAADGSGDTTDIQTGINMLPAGGGVVYLKEGTYTITVEIDITVDNVSIVGSGASAIIDASGVPGVNSLGIDVDANNCTLEDFQISGAWADISVGAGFAGIRIKGIVIDGAGSDYYGVILGSSTGLITNCDITGCEYGISSGAGIDYIRVIDNDLSANVRYGVSLQGENENWMITGNNCSNLTSVSANGIRIQGPGKHNIVIGNICNNNQRGIVVADGTAGVTKEFNIIQGNICNSNSQDGITISSSYNIIIGNVCLNNTVDSIDIEANFNENIIIGNVVDDAIVDGGADTQLAHNVLS